MGNKILPHPENRFSRDAYVLFDDFSWYVTAHQWTAGVAANGTVTKPADSGTSIRLFSTTDNDGAVLATTNEDFKYTAGKALMAEAEVTVNPPNTNACSWAFGWADALAAASVADTTGAITATDACVIHAVNGSLLLRFHTEINGTVQSTVSSTSYVAGASQILRIEVQPVSSTVFEARPFVNGVQLKDANGVPIMHRITLGTATDMDFGLAFKGHHADDATLLSDYVYAAQNR